MESKSPILHNHLFKTTLVFRSCHLLYFRSSFSHNHTTTKFYYQIHPISAARSAPGMTILCKARMNESLNSPAQTPGEGSADYRRLERLQRGVSDSRRIPTKKQHSVLRAGPTARLAAAGCRRTAPGHRRVSWAAQAREVQAPPAAGPAPQAAGTGRAAGDADTPGQAHSGEPRGSAEPPVARSTAGPTRHPTGRHRASAEEEAAAAAPRRHRLGSRPRPGRRARCRAQSRPPARSPAAGTARPRRWVRPPGALSGLTHHRCRHCRAHFRLPPRRSPPAPPRLPLPRPRSARRGPDAAQALRGPGP